jgi:hypothetical protein
MALTRLALLLSVLILTGCATSRPAGGGTSGSAPDGVDVTGTVKAAPACPGPERIDSPCPPKPVPGARVDLESAGTIIATTTADAAGQFRFVTAPGTYRVTAHNVGYKSQNSQDITVVGAMDITIVVDSGMR